MNLFSLFRRVELPQEHIQQDLESTFFSMQVKQLPKNFAEQVMELEMKLEFAESYELETVKQLNDLYRLAVEYYIHEDPTKARHFQRKLTSLLSNPSTISVIDDNTRQAKKESQPTRSNYHQQLKSQLGSFQSQSTVLVQQIIHGSNNKQGKNSRLIQDQLSTQEQQLQRRLNGRSRSKRRMFLSP